MNKGIIPFLLLAAAVTFTVNLLAFGIGQWLIVPIIGAVLLLFSLAGIGFFLARRLGIAAPGMLDAVALGLMACTAFFTLISFSGILRTPAMVAFFAGSSALWAILLRDRQGRAEILEALKRFFARPLPEFAVFVFPLVYASLPPSFFDSLVYHLGIPNLYLQSGGFVATPHFVYANTFIYYEIALMPAVFLGAIVPRLFHFLLGTLFVLTVADDAQERWGVHGRLKLVLALVSLPMTLFLLVTCKNDLPGAMFIFLAIRHHQRQNLKLSAVFWGFAVGIKYFNLLPLAIFLMLTVRPWRKGELKKLAVCAAIVLLAVSPLLLKNFLYAGNPFSPFLAGVFPSSSWDSARFQFLKTDVGRMVHSFADFMRLPYTLSFFNHGFGGMIGPLFLVFLPFLLLRPFPGKKWLLWALLVLATAPFLTGSLRFVYAAIVLLTVFSLRAYESRPSKALDFIFFLIVAVNFTMGFALLEKFYLGHSMLSGQSDSRQYIEHFFPAYPAIAYINAHAPPRARILVVGETRNYYLKRPYQVSSALDYCVLNEYLAPGRSANDFFAALRRDGYSYLLISASELRRLQEGYAIMTAGERDRLQDLLGQIEPVFRHGSVSVYRISRPRDS
jgi:hypothetical protein